MGSIPGSGRSPRRKWHPTPVLLENPMDIGAWWATVHAVAKSRTQLSDFTFTFTLLSFTDLFFTNFLQIEGLRQPCQASLLVPFFQQYLLTSCLCVTFW